MTDTPSAVLERQMPIVRWTGEFRDPEHEQRFRSERNAEDTANTRLVAWMACVGVIPASLIDVMALGWGNSMAVLLGLRVALALAIGAIALRHATSELLLSLAALGVYVTLVVAVWISPTTASMMNFSVANVMIAVEIFLAVRMRTRALVVGFIVMTYPVAVSFGDFAGSVSPLGMASVLSMMALFGWFMGVALNSSRRMTFVAQTNRHQLIDDLEHEIERRTELESRLVQLAEFDGLTGLRNRRSFFETAQAAIDRAGEAGVEVSVLVIDIDHFKSINDNFGHAGGDDVLRDIAARLRDVESHSAVLGRLGGEEFGLLCTGNVAESIGDVAEGLRRSIESLNLHIDGDPASVTVSVGVCTGVVGALAESLRRADVALYEAKRSGRNQVVVYERSLPPISAVAAIAAEKASSPLPISGSDTTNGGIQRTTFP